MLLGQSNRGVGKEWDITLHDRDEKIRRWIRNFRQKMWRQENSLGDLDAGKGLVLKLVLKKQVVKMRGASIYHRIFITICPPIVGICRAMAQSVAGVSAPRQVFDVGLVSVGLVVHEVQVYIRALRVSQVSKIPPVSYTHSVIHHRRYVTVATCRVVT